MDTAKLFRNGGSQAVRLPQKYQFEGSEVVIRRTGDMVILIPYRQPWKALEESLTMLSDDFMEEGVQPAPVRREGLAE